MLEEMIGKRITVITKGFSKTGAGFIYKGILEAEDENFIKLKYEGKNKIYTKYINKTYISEIFTVEE